MSSLINLNLILKTDVNWHLGEEIVYSITLMQRGLDLTIVTNGVNKKNSYYSSFHFSPVVFVHMIFLAKTDFPHFSRCGHLPRQPLLTSADTYFVITMLIQSIWK